MSEIKDIPKHWEIKKLGEVCKILAGYGFPKNIQGSTSGQIPFYKVGDISKNVKAGYRYLKVCDNYINDIILLKLKAKLFPKNTIVFAKIGEGLKLNRRAIITIPGLVDNNAVGLKAIEKACDDMYLFHFLNTVKLEDYSKATTVPSVRKSEIEDIPFPLPPLSEQRAIVAKIEELFSELDNGKKQLLTAQQQLKVYRQSLLKAAFEGKLSEEYITGVRLSSGPPELNIAAEPKVEYKTNDDVDKGELPKGWKWVKLCDLGSWKGGGTPSKQIYKYWENGNNLWVTSKDMKTGIINDSINKITDEAIINSSANRIPKGAILFVMRSGILRHTFPVAIAGKDLTVNQDLQTLTPNGLASSEFIYWFIKAFNNDIRQRCSKDGTTVESIESNSLKNYPFILPTFKEQQKIVEELESKLTVCDKIEETIAQSLQQAETLRQSILKKAFEGRLV